MAEDNRDLDIDADDFGHQGCYVFKPPKTSDYDIDNRPNKKPKITKATTPSRESWPGLLASAEPQDWATLREDAFQSQWSSHEENIREIVQRVDDKILESLGNFVQSKATSPGKLKTGLIVSGPDSNGQKHLVKHLKERLEPSQEILIQLQASQAPNLQIALKNVIRHAIESHSGQDGYASFVASNKRLIHMNFDLELLQKYTVQNRVDRIVVSISDVETFDMSTLSELLSTLASWTDRLHFVALLGIASTVDLFESRLSKSVIRLLDATVFGLGSENDQLYEILWVVQCDPKTKLYFGPSTITTLYELTQDQVTTSESFIRALKYIHMSHFFANPLSVLLAGRLPEDENIAPLCEAIRNTPSFQTHCTSILRGSKSQAESVRRLLNNNSFLLTQSQSAIIEGIDKMQRNSERLATLIFLAKVLSPSSTSLFHLEAQFQQSLSSVADSDIYHTLTDNLKSLHSDDLISLIFAHPEIFTKITHSTVSALTTSVGKLHTTHSTSSIRSAYHPSLVSANSALPFSPNKPATLAAAERSYTSLLDNILSSLSTYVSAITSPTTLFLHEAFLFNSRSPLHSTFVPRPRFAIERALMAPGDYLGCECCENHSSSVMDGRRKEAASVLYNLLNEAGREVNVRDLWDTFRHSMTSATDGEPGKLDARARNGVDGEDEEVASHGGEDGDTDEDENDGTHTLALFYTALSHLKMLGLVKSSSATGAVAGRKGVDVIARTNWKGL